VLIRAPTRAPQVMQVHGHGSVGVALACAAAGIPFVVAAPSATVDLATSSGDEIEIELRSGDEVTRLSGLPTTPAVARGFNPAFDVTPAAYMSAVDTELGIVEPGPGVTVDTIAGETS
jgi:methylthioribose-1-phosphate isomerase